MPPRSEDALLVGIDRHRRSVDHSDAFDPNATSASAPGSLSGVSKRAGRIIIPPKGQMKEVRRSFFQPAHSPDLPGRLFRDTRVQPLSQKYSSSLLTQITFISAAIPSRERGVSRSSRTLGAGCGGRHAIWSRHMSLRGRYVRKSGRSADTYFGSDRPRTDIGLASVSVHPHNCEAFVRKLHARRPNGSSRRASLR